MYNVEWAGPCSGATIRGMTLDNLVLPHTLQIPENSRSWVRNGWTVLKNQIMCVYNATRKGENYTCEGGKTGQV